jgi:hypothetical protein
MLRLPLMPDNTHQHPVFAPPDSARTPVLVGYAAAITAMFGLRAGTTSDTDLWGHVRFGQDLLRTWALPHVDPRAFTSDRPWINHEWLAELAMGAAFDAAGVAGLLILKAALLLGSLIVVAWAVDRAAGGQAAGIAIFGLASLMGVVPLFATLRPQGFSVLLFAIEAAILAAPAPRLLAMAPLFALWANLHGGWVMGLGTFGVWVALSLIWPGARQNRVGTAAAGVAAVLATLINPYGVGLWQFLWDTVGFARPDIVEWQSLDRLPVLLIPWAITVGLAVWTVLTRRATLPAIGTCVLLAIASFRVARLVPFFGLATGIILMPGVGAAANAGRSRSLLAAAGLATALAIVISVAQAGTLVCWPPSRGLQLDPQAHAFIRANDLQGRMVVWFDWGEYVLWHFPHLAVSIDGRRETVYSERTLVAHQDFYSGGANARAYLDTLSPDYVWLPPVLPVSRLMAQWGWLAIFESEHSTIWTRRSGSYLPAGALLPACFPGP